jgi:NAD(P)H-dependent flavin oxidoreductase YrpB (nitropropane dioxygenase family)
VVEGDRETGSLMAGQISGLIREVVAVRVIIEGMARQAAAILSRGVDFPVD